MGFDITDYVSICIKCSQQINNEDATTCPNCGSNFCGYCSGVIYRGEPSVEEYPNDDDIPDDWDEDEIIGCCRCTSN